MALTINGLLLELASEYYISNSSSEAKKIDSSVVALKTKLLKEFKDEIVDVIEFGSYKRDTILPRRIDDKSDVDLMIVFDHENINMTPGTYRKYLHDFSNTYYRNSIVFKSKPTVVLELNHIKYDLVPAYTTSSIWSGETTYIPESDTAWMSTDPHGFNQELVEKNKSNKNLIKPLIRLMKAWNAKAGYPFESFELEKNLVNNWYVCTTLEDYFFSSINKISSYHTTTFTTQKVSALKQNADKIKLALQHENWKQAETWLTHILPI